MYTVENRGQYVFLSVDEEYQQYDQALGSRKTSKSAAMLDQMVNEALDEAGHPVPAVLDLRHFKITWSELVASLSETDRGDSMFRHHNLTKVLVVTESGLLKLGAMALNQAQYGSKNVIVFKTVEEALAQVEQLA